MCAYLGTRHCMESDMLFDDIANLIFLSLKVICKSLPPAVSAYACMINRTSPAPLLLLAAGALKL